MNDLTQPILRMRIVHAVENAAIGKLGLKLLIITGLAIVGTSAFAWMNPWPNYKNQFAAADLVGIVRVIRVKETGEAKAIEDGVNLLFRKVEVELHVLSVFKGQSKEKIDIVLFRCPTKEECIADFGEQQGEIAWFMVRVGGTGREGYFIPKEGRDYLAYLRKHKDLPYLPVGGFISSLYSILEVKGPLELNRNEAEQRAAG